jgi:hypothetical protein
MLPKTEFRVTGLNACVPGGVPVVWQGRELASGPLTIELEDSPGNRGELDYEERRARAEFHVRLGFPELAATLGELGVDPSLTAPVRAVLRSEGAILEDHSFALSGRCELAPHAMLTDQRTEAAVLPGH